ncbi:MAG: RHS repeat-associated core domain-containing protein, partial [Acidobacteriota bacterium]
MHNGVNYQTNADVHMRSLITSEIIKKDLSIPVQNAESRTEYEYDNYNGGLNSGLLDRPFAPNDTSRATGYGTGRILRGNLTKVNNGANGSQPAPTHFHYDIAGNVVKILGPLASSVNSLHSKSIDYAQQFNFAYPTSTTQQVTKSDGSGILTLTSSQDYDLHTGLLKSSTGFNPSETVTYQYNDLLDRLTAEIRPTGLGRTDYFYSPPTTYPSWVRSETQLDASRDLISTSYFDGLLKPIKSERNDAGSGAIVYSETRYDGIGRAFLVSNPRRTITANTDGWTRTKFDGLGRVVSVASYDSETQTTCTAPGCSGEVTTIYQGTTVTVTDQALKQRKSTSDVLGRLIEVTEPDSGGGLSLVTSYEYDARSNLKTVIQGSQVRTFVYDALSRLTTASAPESGTTSYSYDAASNLLTRTDARGATIGRVNYTYDELNRIRTKSYPDTSINPVVTYHYDNANIASLPPPPFDRGAALGRLVAITTSAIASQGETGSYYGYGVGGRLIHSSQLLDGQHYQSSASYNEASLLTLETYHPNAVNTQTSYNVAGQVDTIVRSGITYTDVGEYSAAGGLKQQQLGNSLYHTINYNNRLQPVSISLGTTAGGQQRLNLAYDYGRWMDSLGSGTVLDQTKNNGNIGRLTITPGSSSNPIEQDFEYDELNRVKLAKEFAFSGVITTIAGNGTQGFSGDGGPATAAQLNTPGGGLSIDASGNLYIGEGEHVRKVTPGGIISTTYANPGSQGIGGVLVHGNVLYISDSANLRVLKTDLNGTLIDVVADLSDGLLGPAGIAVDTTSNVYFGDPSVVGEVDSDRVFKVDTSGTVSVIAGTGTSGYNGDGIPANTAQLNNPQDVALDSAGNIYIADFSNSRIRKIDALTNIITTIAGTGTDGYNGDGIFATAAQLSGPSGVAVDSSDNIFIADSGNNRIRKIDATTGIISTVVGTGTAGYNGDNIPPASANLNNPFGVRILESNNIHIADSLNHRIRKASMNSGGTTLSWSQAFIYDRFGNKTCCTPIAGTGQGEGIQISQTNNRITEPNFVYDPAGNLIQEGIGKNYSYDAENRMRTAVVDGVTTTYNYDGNGRRVKKTVGTTSTRFVYDLAGRLIAEYEGSAPIGSPTKEYIYGPTGLLAIKEGTDTRYVTSDQLGSVRIVTDGSGNVIRRQDYYAFGEIIEATLGGRNAITGYGGVDNVRQKFATYERDDETGLDFAQARYYSNSLGRFTSADPVGLSPYRITNPQAWNRYSYVTNT